MSIARYNPMQLGLRASTMKLCSILVLFVVINLLDDVNAMWSEFELQGVENMNGTDSMPINFQLTVKRVRKGIYGISGAVEITDAFDPYTAEVLIYHSPARNGDYKQIAPRIPEGPLCDKVRSEYRKYIMKDLKTVSDLPYSENSNEDLCPMFVVGVKHDVKSYEFDKSTLPKFLQAGAYQAHIILRKDGIARSGVVANVDLS